MTNYCKCGCGLIVEKNYKKGHARRGRKNSKKHNKSISKANAGRIASKETRKKMSENATGRQHTEETKRKMSKIAKEKNFGLWMKRKKATKESIEKGRLKKIGHKVSKETRKKIGEANSGKKNGMYGKTHSKKIKKSISEKSKKNWENKELRNRILNHKNRINNCRKGAIATMKKLKSKRFQNTAPEIEMEKILKKLGYEYIKQFEVENIEHTYLADFYLPNKNIIIEVDGRYWHNYPEGRKLDKVRGKELLEKGIVVLRFWEKMFDEISVKNKVEKA